MKIDNTLLSAALDGLEAQRARIEKQIAEIRGMLGGAKRSRGPKAASGLDDWEPPASAVATKKPRRKMSAKARKAIAAAQKKRWEAYHAAQNK